MTTTDRVKELAASVGAPCYAPGKVPATQRAPYSVLFGGGDTPQARLLCATPEDRTTWRLMAVSSTHDGARLYAATLRRAIDTADADGDPLLVAFVPDPLEDRDDPSDISWTVTLEIHHYPKPPRS